MKKALILDTNFIIENSKQLEKIKEEVKEYVDIFIPKIVIQEVKSQKSRQMEDTYNKITDLINQNKKYLDYKENFKFDEVKETRESGIEKFLTKYCDNNVIDYSKDMFEQIVERALYKLPPFMNDVNSSDKGFKDALLWLSILKFKNLKKYESFILLTNDKNAFLKKENILKEEFLKETNKPIVFISNNLTELYEYLGLSKKTVVEDISTKDNSNTFEIEIEFNNIKEELNKYTEKMIYSSIYNNFTDEIDTEKNFTIFQKVNEQDIKKLFEELPQYIQEHIFFDFIDITEILNKVGISSQLHYNVPIESIKKLNNIYIELKGNEEFYKPFIIYITNKMNKLYKYVPKYENDPFADYEEIVPIEDNNDYIIDDDFLQ